MIIFGTRTRLRQISSGNFFCPNCRVQRPYIYKRAAQYFTLYFIPLFPVKQLGEYVECQVCKKTYKPEVLKLMPPA